MDTLAPWRTREIQAALREATGYINIKTGEMVSLSYDEVRAPEEGEEENVYGPWMTEEMLEKLRDVLGSDDYIELPTKFDINDYQIMKRFCLSRDNEDLRHELLNAIRGKGAFRPPKRRFPKRPRHRPPTPASTPP